MNWNTCNTVFEVFPVDGEILIRTSSGIANRDEVIWSYVRE